MFFLRFRAVLLILLACFLSACAATPTQVVKERYFWPPPPSDPRIEWLGVYYDETDLPGATKSKFFESMLGESNDLHFQSPLFVASNSAGWIVVSDPTNNGFISINLNTRKFEVLGGAAMTAVTKPTGVDFDAEGLLYAGDDPSRRIYVVNKDNRVVKVLDLSKQLKSIGGFIIDKKLQRLIIPDAKMDKIAIFSLDGKLLKTFGKRGDMEGEFNRPNSAAIDSHGNIYVVDTFNARVQKFTPEGVYLTKIGKRGDAIGDFGIIKGIALDSDDNVYVTDARFNRIMIFSSDGVLLLTVGSAHSQQKHEAIMAAGFLLPQGIYIDKANQVYVADMMNRRLQVLQYIPESKSENRSAK